MSGYQCDKAVTKMIPVKWYNIISLRGVKFGGKNRPFSKMAAEILYKSKLKTNTSARKSTLTLVTLPSFDIPGEISAEKVENGGKL